VDLGDDAIHRWVVRHTEHRVALLRARWARGKDVDPAEHITGQAYEPGYRQRQQSDRLRHRAMECGCALTDPRIELPTDVSFISARRRS
jgi:hypothetical protein